MEPISNRQRRTIFAIAGTLGMDEDTLHDLAFDVTGKQSLRALTCDEALRLIRELEKRQGPRPPKPRPAARKKKDSAPPSGASEAQKRKVWALMYKLEDASPSTTPIGNRLCGIIKKELRQDAFPKDPFLWIDYHKCSKLIDILKQYVDHAQKKGAEKHG